jgi:hypothetical protein
VVVADKPLIVEVKVPVPVAFVVFVLKDTIGPVLVDQTTPRAVIDAPPSDVMLPPLLAPVDVISPIVVVVKVANITAFTVMLPVASTLPQPPVKGMV